MRAFPLVSLLLLLPVAPVAAAVTTFAHDLTIKTGKGDDTIDLSGAQIGGVAKVDPGKGTNTLSEAP